MPASNRNEAVNEAVVNVAVQPRKSLRFRGRSFMALVLAPTPPLEEWMRELDDWARRSPGFFNGRPIILDVSALPVDKDELATLVSDLVARDIRAMGIEGTKASCIGPGMPPLVSGGRQSGVPDSIDPPPRAEPPKKQAEAAAIPTPPAPPLDTQPTALLHDSPVRSGQSVIFPHGDVTIIGSVASGAEVIAAGSVHVYGALRGRAIAGSMGNSRARIFCNKLEAELLAIDGLYRTADEIEPQYRGKPFQAWLEGDAMLMATLS
jgi:septum site-determining protein MinC